MVSFTAFVQAVLALSATVQVTAAPTASYFWSSWSDGKSKLNTKNEADGKFSVTWSGDKGNFVIGKGWNPGGNRYD